MVDTAIALGNWVENASALDDCCRLVCLEQVAFYVQSHVKLTSQVRSLQEQLVVFVVLDATSTHAFELTNSTNPGPTVQVAVLGVGRGELKRLVRPQELFSTKHNLMYL